MLRSSVRRVQRVARVLSIAVAGTLAAIATNGDESALGRVLLKLPHDAKVTLVHHASGEQAVLRGRGFTLLRELRAGAWSLQRFDITSQRRRSNLFALDRYAFMVAPGKVGFLGDWDVWPNSLIMPKVGSGGAGAGPSNEIVGCACDPAVVEKARARWPVEVGDREVGLLCAAYHPAVGQLRTNEPPYLCEFLVEAR